MSLLSQITAPASMRQTVEAVDVANAAVLQAELDGANLTIEDLRESLADVELMLEDRGWQQLGVWGETQFTRDGIGQSARLCRVMAVANPLIRRGLGLRCFYVWGMGVAIQARAQGGDDGEQDVNAVVQGFLDDPDVRKRLTGPSARETNERTLGTDGNLFAALFTAPRTGRVQPRLVPLDEIVEVIKNPEDRSEPWLYRRVSTGADGGVRTTYHPDIDYRPAVRPRTIGSGRDDYGRLVDAGEVLWDAPILHVKVNALPDWDFGIGDAFAAIAWARAYKEFLEDWARLCRALSKFAWRLTAGKKGAAQKAAARVGASQQTVTGEAGFPPGGSTAGQTAAMVGTSLEAIPKSGATIDSESGRPLAGMVAAGLDVPVTMLLADPGVTGARATAETLDTPTELMAGMRRDVWGEFFRRLLGYVIESSVRAPQGALTGQVGKDEWGRPVVTLDGDTPATIEVDWPPLEDTPLNVLMAAITSADDTGLLPPLVIVRQLLAALGVDDPDEIIADLTDDDGNYKPPAGAAGQAAVDAFRTGQDPAALLGDGNGQDA